MPPSGPSPPPLDIQGVLLVGGLGTRLRPVLADRPKALAPVRGRPLVAYLLDQLCDAGIPSTVLCVGYLASMIEQSLGPTHRTMRLDYSSEDEPLGTGGALRHALPRLAAGNVLAMNGDSWCDVDLRAFIADHRAHRAEASIVLVTVDDASRFGRVVVAGDGCVERFEEKTPAAGAGLINAGIYLLNREVVSNIPAARSVSLEREVFPALARRGALRAFVTTGKFIDIGTPESLRAAESFFR